MKQKVASPANGNDKGDSDFERSIGLNEGNLGYSNVIDKNNPFIIQNNIIGEWQNDKISEKPSVIPSNKPSSQNYQLPIDDDYKDEEDIDFPPYMKDNNPFDNDSILKRPKSSKQSERYSKC